MLAPLKPFHRTVSVIPQTGIQFLDFGFNLAALPKTVRSFWEEIEAGEPGPDGRQPVNLRCLHPDSQTQELIDPVTNASPPDNEIYSLNHVRGLEPFLRKWTPLPYFRIKSRSPQGTLVFDRGPTNWARVMVVALEEPDGDGNTHRVVLAFDTNLIEREPERPYLAPSPTDSSEEQEFAFAPSEADNSWFLDEMWVDQWLEETFLDMKRTQRKGKPLRDEDLPNLCEHWARYLTMLQTLTDAAILPRVKLVDTVSKSSKYVPIDVDLVLDVGNSRTCGILIETYPDMQPNLNDSYVLQLRDLSEPQLVYDRPFSSRIEFARASFGYDAMSRRSGRINAFFWPTVLRVGPEATRLAGRRLGTEGSTGLSSPKRYLWDQQPVNQVWRFNGTSGDGSKSDPPVSGPLLGRVTEEGDVLRMLRNRGQPAVRARFCRSSLYSLMLNEIITQALTTINAPGLRSNRKFEEVPRRLRRIILTLPPAMPLAEQRVMRMRAEAAVKLTWDMLGWSGTSGARPEPKVFLELDEASCTQLVYLYNEITQKFRGDAPLLLKLFGKPRPQSGTEPVLRIASIDIGGGTTDLMIMTFGMESNRLVLPQQNFREGFKLAGDDVMQAIIEQHVLPPIARAIEKAGIADPLGVLRDIFSGDRGNQSELERHQRRLFVSQVLSVISLGMLARYELWDPLAPEVNEIQPFAWFFRDSDEINPDIVGYLDRAVGAMGATLSIRDIEFVIDFEAVHNTVTSVLGPILADLCEVVHAYDCDILLLSGRPSRLPAVRTTVLGKVPVTADRVIAMHTYQVGVWYPFRDRNSRIEDPKSTAAVGALLCMLAEGQLEAFSMRTKALSMRSTARYIGEMEISGQIRRERVLFAGIDLDKKQDKKDKKPADDSALVARMRFYAPVFIGFRQLDLERWPATPLYRMEFGNPQSAANMKRPLTVTIRRGEVDPDDEAGDNEARKEDFEIEEIEDAEKSQMRKTDVVLRLQTLKDEAGVYWLDTGQLTVFDSILAMHAHASEAAQ